MSQISLDFDYLKRAVSFDHVLLATGLIDQFSSRGDRLVGPCPLHRGDNPRAFVIHRSKNLWYCFTRCATGGDLIDFVRRLDGCSYRETARYLAHLAGQPTCAPVPHCSNDDRTFRPFSSTLHLHYHCDFLMRKRIHHHTAFIFGAGLYPGNGWLKRCIAVRLFLPDGSPIGYAGRRLDHDEIIRYGKWKFPAKLPAQQLLFNIHRIKPWLRKACFIVECPWAVMRLYQLQIPAVALMGTRLHPAQHELLKDVPRLVLMMDGDPAGYSAGTRLKSLLGPNATLVRLPANKDPDDLTDDELCAYRPLLFS